MNQENNDLTSTVVDLVNKTKTTVLDYCKEFNGSTSFTNNFYNKFQDKTPEKKSQIYDLIINSYPNTVPVIFLFKDFEVEHCFNKTNLICNYDTTFHNLKILIIENDVVKSLNYKQSLQYFTLDGRVPSNSDTMLSIYLKHKSQDNFLYLCVDKENTFG